MKLRNQSFQNKAHWVQWCVVALALGVATHKSNAVLYSTNYTGNGGATYGVTYDTAAEGFTEWSLNGLDHLQLQSLYISVNDGPVTPLASTSVTIGNSGATGKKFTIDYNVGGVGTVRQTATFGSSGTFGDTIRFQNTSGSALDVSIFQFSHFVLGGAIGNQSVSLTPATGIGSQAFASQTSGGYQFTWAAQATGFTTLVQADGTGAPFGAFIGSGSDLNNTTLNANNTFAVFGFEFSGNVANGNYLTISETAAFPVPEPSALALISAGILILAWKARRRGARAI